MPDITRPERNPPIRAGGNQLETLPDGVFDHNPGLYTVYLGKPTTSPTPLSWA